MDAVLFDMFGVVAMDQSPTVREAMVEYSGHGHDAFWAAYWAPRKDYDRGDLDGPAYWQAVGGLLGTAFSPDRVERLLSLDLESWSRLNEESVELVSELADARVPLGLLSNIPPELAARFEERHARLLELFPVLGLSCRIGHAKPEADAYRWCLERMGAAGEVLFVDDNRSNVEAARALGLRGHVFTSVPELRRALGRP
ncbi:HAD superfamily hydrolase [Nocardiopsis terrae]|uniref:Hydrolase of the HAD superfamily n=1 Tax=Nocardiopsis terrae TaxID=372655 RepID=A0ABR9HCU0_9ACTN|nr:HAD family phosphatase [Nocardiopsis terrae]MBE1456831.1 putative hydrolase of the HAD superfamily [Nocardiopsis terrae]GHC74889.1 HAD superfamily hydrolase [Nocardiopsis terrae]